MSTKQKAVVPATSGSGLKPHQRSAERHGGRWPSTAFTPKTSPWPNAGVYSKSTLGVQAAKGVVLGDEITLLRVLIRRFAEQIQASQGVAPSESAQHLAVVSEAMLRLCWSKAEPPKRSEGGSLLRTDHMLGGAQSSTFTKQLSLVLEEITDENSYDEPGPKRVG